MSNVNELKRFLADKRAGDVFEIATSQYADNTTKPGHRFDFYSTGQAVKSLVKQGWIEANDRWRYSDVTVLRREWAALTCPKLRRAYKMVCDAREILFDAADNPDFREGERDAVATFCDALMDAKDSYDTSEFDLKGR